MKKAARPRKPTTDTSVVESSLISHKLVLSLHEASALVSMHPWTLRQYVAQGELKTLRLPSVKGSHPNTRRILIAREDLDAFIAKFRPRTESSASRDAR